MTTTKVIIGSSKEVLKTLPEKSVDMVITSPPYWMLRNYGVPEQLGLEPTFQEYINSLCDIFDEAKRVLKDAGSCWVNIADTYSTISGAMGNIAGLHQPKFSKQAYESLNFKQSKSDYPSKCLLNIPSRFAIEMTNRGWILRNKIIWHKPDSMPSSAKDRFTVDFEEIFFFTKNPQYYFEQQHDPLQHSSLKRLSQSTYNLQQGSTRAHGGFKTNGRIKALGDPEKGRNKRCVWSIPTAHFKEAHYAVYPAQLIETPIKAGCPKGGVVLDMFFGSGTTGVVANKLGRNCIGIELNPEFPKLRRELKAIYQ